MEQKKQILVVTNDISEEEVAKIRAAMHPETTCLSEIQVTLVHVIPRLPTCYFNIPAIGTLVEKYYYEAKCTLVKIGNHLSVSKQDQWLLSGKMRTEILRLATKLGSHFILAGAKQIQELQRSLFFKNQQYAVIKNINHYRLEQTNEYYALRERQRFMR